MRNLGAAVATSAVMLLLASCGGSSSTGGAADDTITLRVGTGLPDQHGMWQGDVVAWMDSVEELTDGQVVFETFTGGELVNATEEIDAVRDGTLDVALMIPSYSPDEFAMADVTLLPTSGADTYVYSAAYRRLMDDNTELVDGKSYNQLMFEDQGLKVFPVDTLQPYLISTTGVAPDSLAALRGMSLRTPAQVMEIYASNAGISGITMPAVDMYDALSRGAFDGSFITVPDWTAYGFQDLFKYTLTDFTFGTFNGAIGMTAETWEGLPQNVQEAMTQASADSVGAGSDLWVAREKEIVPEYESEGGVFQSFDELPADVQGVMLDASEETWTDFIATMEDRGLPGHELAILWRDLVVEEGGEVPEAITQLD